MTSFPRASATASGYRWVILAINFSAWLVIGALVQGLPSIGPRLQTSYGLNLAQLGLVLGGVTAGMSMSLLGWGMITDRVGERRVLMVGLSGVGCGLVLAAQATEYGALLIALALTGAFAASCNGASARAIMGWFAQEERGLAMGVQQAAIPLGSAAAAVGLPMLAAEAGPRACLLVLAGMAAVAAGAATIGFRVPGQAAAAPRTGRSPLTDSGAWRLAGASFLLAAPQFGFVAFLVVCLNGRWSMSLQSAAIGLVVLQVVAAVSRVAIGRYSDRAGNRERLLAAIAGAQVLALPVAAGGIVVGGPGGLVAMGPAALLAVCWNGLANVVAAEMAPAGRSGTAVAFQSASVLAGSALTPPLFGLIVPVTSWAIAFGLLALPALLATALLRPLVFVSRGAAPVAAPERFAAPLVPSR